MPWGITFEHLIAKGITPQIMAAFALPLSDWPVTELGFGLQHAVPMRSEDCKLVFDIEKTDFIRMLQTFQPTAKSTSTNVMQ